jgi:hypothetical protein
VEMLGSNTWMIVGGSARVEVIAGVTVLCWKSYVMAVLGSVLDKCWWQCSVGIAG